MHTLKHLFGALGRPRRSAHAHTGTHSYAIVEIDHAAVTGTVQFPVNDLNDVLGLSVPLAAAGAAQAIAENREAIDAYIDEHFSVSSGSSPWPVKLGACRVLERSKFTYAIFEYAVDPPMSEVPLTFSLNYDGIVAAKPSHEGMAIVRQHVGVGRLRSKSEQRWAVLPGKTSFTATVQPDSVATHVSGSAKCLVDTGREYLRRARKRLRGGA